MCGSCDENRVWVSLPLAAAVGRTYKVAVSLRELLTQTNEFSKKNVDGCIPVLKDSKPSEMYLRYNVKCSLKSSDPNGHDVRVRFDYWNITDSSRYDNLDVNVSCSCPAFLYWGAQWNLNKQHALEGDPREKLVAPTEKLELRNGFLICKHVKVVLDRIIPSVQRVINDLARKERMRQIQEEEEKVQRQKRSPKPRPGEGGVDVKPTKPKTNPPRTPFQEGKPKEDKPEPRVPSRTKPAVDPEDKPTKRPGYTKTTPRGVLD